MRYFFLLLILSFSIESIAQEPKWLDAEYRSQEYSTTIYLVGYSSDNKLKNENVADAIERVNKFAKAYVAESIITTIESFSLNNTQSVSKGKSESFSNVFESSIKSETKADIAGIKVESYFDKEKKMVYAFAYVNKYELKGYYKSQLTLINQQIKNHITIGQEYFDKSEKPKAKNEFLKTVPLFAKIEYAQRLLAAISSSTEEEEYFIQDLTTSKLKVNEALLKLEQGIYVFISCSAEFFEINYTALENQLKSELAKNNCSFTNDKNQADWIIEIKSHAREYSHMQKIYFSYVNASVRLTKTYNNKQVYQNEFEIKGASMDNYKVAAEKAYDKLPLEISKELLEHVLK